MGESLQAQAQQFARSLSDLASAFVGHAHPFVATTLGERIVIQSDAPISIATPRRTLFSVTSRYRCTYDSAGQYLVVEESEIKVFGGCQGKGDPLFRVEYVGDQASHLPCAHLHMHAHRDQLSVAMAVAGTDGAERRTPKHGDDYMRGTRISELHFPVGGHRFRPGLEDVLQWMVTEFGASTGPTWPTVWQVTAVGAGQQVETPCSAARTRRCRGGWLPEAARPTSHVSGAGRRGAPRVARGRRRTGRAPGHRG